MNLPAPKRNSLLRTISAAAVYLFFVYGPLLAIMLSDISNISQTWILSLPTGRRLDLLINSSVLALVTAGACSVIGFFAAVWLQRRVHGWVHSIKWVLMILAPIPPYIHALAWSWFFNKASGIIPGIPVSGGGITLWVQMMSFIPLAAAASLLGINAINPELISAGRIFNSDKRILYKILVPLASPAILTACGLIFILSFLDYSVPSLFQYNVYAMEIFADFSAHFDPVRALLLSLPLILISTVVLGLFLSKLRSLALKNRAGGPNIRLRLNLPPALASFETICIGVFGLQMLIPTLSHLNLVRSPDGFLQALMLGQREMITSILVALGAGIVSIFVSWHLATILAQKDRSLSGWWLFTLIPLAVPPPLVGIGMEIIWNRPNFQSIYTSNLILLLAVVARFLPFAVIMMAAQKRRIDPGLIEAASIYRLTGVQGFTRVLLPLHMPGILLAAGVVFILSLGELGATLLVVPPGKSTLALRIYNFLHYGASGTVAGLSLGLMLSMIIGGSLAIAGFRLSSRYQRRINN
jgi:iron(III) transport system permease protein